MPSGRRSLALACLAAAAYAQSVQITVETSTNGDYAKNHTVSVPINTIFTSNLFNDIRAMYMTGAEGVDVGTVECSPHIYSTGLEAVGNPLDINTPAFFSPGSAVGSLVCLDTTLTPESESAITDRMVSTSSRVSTTQSRFLPLITTPSPRPSSTPFDSATMEPTSASPPFSSAYVYPSHSNPPSTYPTDSLWTSTSTVTSPVSTNGAMVHSTTYSTTWTFAHHTSTLGFPTQDSKTMRPYTTTHLHPTFIPWGPGKSLRSLSTMTFTSVVTPTEPVTTSWVTTHSFTINGTPSCTTDTEVSISTPSLLPEETRKAGARTSDTSAANANGDFEAKAWFGLAVGTLWLAMVL